MLQDERQRHKLMISFRSKGSFTNTTDFLKRLSKMSIDDILNHYGDEGVAALRNATPVDSGLTADSWYYEIVKENGQISIRWNNRNVNKGVNIAVILQYGHGTRNGGYVQGRDYINPALQPIFDQIANKAWKEVTK